MTKNPKDSHLPTTIGKGKTTLPALQHQARRLVEGMVNGTSKGEEKIPNASLIYGIASALLVSIALYYLFTGGWFNGFMVFVLGVALFGYALHFMQNPD